MKAALLRVRHVQKLVILVRNIAETLEWNNAKSCAGHAPMRAANVRKHAGMEALVQHKQLNNVPMPAVPVPKNAKNMITNIASVVLKNAETCNLLVPSFSTT